MSNADPRHPDWLPGAILNIADSCFWAAGESTAIKYQDATGGWICWTVNDLDDATRRVAAGLNTFGLAPGDAIAIDMPMTHWSVAIYLGIIRAGMVAVSVADSFSATEIATRLRIANAKAVFTQDVIRRGGRTLPMYEKVR